MNMPAHIAANPAQLLIFTASEGAGAGSLLTTPAGAGSARGTIRDLHSLAAASTPEYRTVWWRGGGTLCREAAEEREWIHVHHDGPVRVGFLQADAHEAVFTVLELVLRDRRPQHVSQQRLAA